MTDDISALRKAQAHHGHAIGGIKAQAGYDRKALADTRNKVTALERERDKSQAWDYVTGMVLILLALVELIIVLR